MSDEDLLAMSLNERSSNALLYLLSEEEKSKNKDSARGLMLQEI